MLFKLQYNPSIYHLNSPNKAKSALSLSLSLSHSPSLCFCLFLSLFLSFFAVFLLLFLSPSFVYCSLLLRCLHLFPSPTLSLSLTISLYFIHWLYLQGNKANDTLEVCARCILFRPTYALKHLEDPEGTSNRTLWRRDYEGGGGRGGGGGGYKLLADVYPPPPFPSRII